MKSSYSLQNEIFISSSSYKKYAYLHSNFFMHRVIQITQFIFKNHKLVNYHHWEDKSRRSIPRIPGYPERYSLSVYESWKYVRKLAHFPNIIHILASCLDKYSELKNFSFS